MFKPDLSGADQCVMCGMCQPHCPTYHIHHTESESPRGRLSMILGLAQHQLEADDSIIEHLYNCTSCGACERICPSRVPYLQLLDSAKSTLRNKTKRNLALKSLLFLVSHPARYSWLASALKNMRMGNLLRRLGMLDASTSSIQQQVATLPEHTRLQSYYPSSGEALGDVALFTGCISQLFDHATLQDTILLLTHCGYNVHVPGQQVCCGALHQHNGEIESSNQLAEQNMASLDLHQFDAIIGTSTGCTIQLASYLERPVVDIMQFVIENDLHKALALKPLDARIALHTPCSQQQRLSTTALIGLFGRIPGSDITELTSNQFCCGAGGSQLVQPTSSTIPLRQIKVDDIQQTEPDILVSTNYGCALHMSAGLEQSALTQDKQITICHPVSLLVQSASLK